jgi:glycosyltransferase involved in cell wall biosynthesis
MSLISVIIPCYNRANIISVAIESVINQTFQEWELIIVDDGSTDNSKDIIFSFLTDVRIKYFYQENNGVSAARNYGVSKSNGDYVVFLDTDDYFYPHALISYQKEILKNKELQLCFAKFFSENRVQGLNRNYELFGSFSISNIPGSFCFNKVFFQKIGGYIEGSTHSENYELIIRAINSPFFNQKTATIEEPVFYYYQWKNSEKIVLNKRNKIISYTLFFNRCEKKTFLAAFYSHQIALNYAGLGYFKDTIKWSIVSIKQSNSRYKYYFKPILIYFKRKIINY